MSARDPNGAQQIASVTKRALELEWFDLRIFADEPGFAILAAQGLPVREVRAPAVASAADANAAALLATAGAIFAEIVPDAVLVGLSGPDAGIDEALLAACDTARTYAIQDFWGDVNKVLGRPAGLYFVTDEEAARWTRALHDVSAEVTGQPKYSDLEKAEIPRLAARHRETLDVPGDTALVGFFGQPLWHLDGYRQSLAALARSVAALERPARLLFRPHPKEEALRLSETRRILDSASVDYVVDTVEGIDAVLAACDVVCTAYSSCGYDTIAMARVAARPLGVVVYIMPPDLRDAYRKATGLRDLPPVRDGTALLADDLADVTALLRKALLPRTRHATWTRIQERVPDPAGAADRILRRIRADLARAGKQGDTRDVMGIPDSAMAKG